MVVGGSEKAYLLDCGKVSGRIYRNNFSGTIMFDGTKRVYQDTIQCLRKPFKMLFVFFILKMANSFLHFMLYSWLFLYCIF